MVAQTVGLLAGSVIETGAVEFVLAVELETEQETVAGLEIEVL